jgi:hypothetical protein
VREVEHARCARLLGFFGDFNRKAVLTAHIHGMVHTAKKEIVSADSKQLRLSSRTTANGEFIRAIPTKYSPAIFTLIA